MAAVLYHGNRRSRTPSAIESLPAEILVTILEFGRLPERVRLASCSKLLQRLVFSAEPLWVQIDLRDEDYTMMESLTDAMLSSLLVRVNARHVTRSLSLYPSRTNLRGFGLAPLSLSGVLENVRLCTGLDEKTIIPILRSMVPHKLFYVRFGGGTLVAPSSDLTSFLHDLRVTKLQQAQDQQIACMACQEPVTGDSRQIVAKRTGPPSTRCDACRNHFCRRSCCSVGVLDCHRCGDTSCSACEQVKQCDMCALSYCDYCDGISTCDECSKDICESCSEFFYCCLCEKMLCHDCNRERGHFIGWCEECSEEYCSDCRTTAWCEVCETRKCDDCAQVRTCSRCNDACCVFCREVTYLSCCNSFLCAECETPEKCNHCLANFCGDSVSKCESCLKQFCSDCVEVAHCQGCQKDYCGGCRQVNFFDCCEKAMCVECKTPEQSCDECNKNVCIQHTRRCQACEGTFCEKCSKVARCSACSTDFCSDCRQVSAFDCCQMSMCTQCMVPKKSCESVGCAKIVCSEHVRICGGCEHSFCTCCREMERCGRCSLCFCGDDCAFVDECEQCQTTYCEECALIVRCGLCGHSSCERCRRTVGGFCARCNETPQKTSKKRRRS